MKNDDHSELQKLLRLKRYEEPKDEYFDNFVWEARQRRSAEAASPQAGFAAFVKGQLAEILRPKWVLGAGLGAAYAGVMAAILLWPNEGSSISKANIIPASTEIDFSFVPIREADFSRELSDLSAPSQPKEF